MRRRFIFDTRTPEPAVARPELGAKRLCPNCGTKYYDLNHDPITCPKCHALFATGLISGRAAAAEDEEEDVDADDEGIELVALEVAADDETEDADAIATEGDDVVVDVDADDDALIDEVDDDEVSDVVRGGDEDEEEER
jgi:uncharacterized protein (TIGR02300 family)